MTSVKPNGLQGVFICTNTIIPEAIKAENNYRLWPYRFFSLLFIILVLQKVI